MDRNCVQAAAECIANDAWMGYCWDCAHRKCYQFSEIVMRACFWLKSTFISNMCASVGLLSWSMHWTTLLQQTYRLYLICAAGKRECTMKLEKKKKIGPAPVRKTNSINCDPSRNARPCLFETQTKQQTTHSCFFPFIFSIIRAIVWWSETQFTLIPVNSPGIGQNAALLK